LILINDGSTPLNEGQNEPTPGNTKDMGIFNFNHDKDATKTLGFDSDIFPNCASYEVTANSDTSAGAFMSFGISHIKVGMVEQLDYTNLIASNHFRTKMTNTGDTTLVNVHFYRDDGFILDATFEVLPGNSVDIPEGTTKFRLGLSAKTFNINNILIEVTDNLYTDDNNALPTHYEIVEDPQAELAYIKESFELRHPDEDDVAEDWGFMGVDEEVNCVRYYNFTGIGYYVLSKIPRDGRDSVVIETGNKCVFGLSIYDANMKWLRNDFSATNERPYTFSEFEQYFSVIIPNSENIQDVSYIMVDGSKYFIDEEVFVDDTGLPYVGSFKKEGTGLKALIDWVDNCTDEEFVNDFEEHFHKDYTLRYFCLVTLVGAVDNLG
jgi:hypothetical protein